MVARLAERAAHQAGFDGFVREGGTPAEAISLPPEDLERPSPDHLTAVAAKDGIEILGPPGMPS